MRPGRAWLAAVAAVFLATSASAQTGPTLPAMRFVTAPLVSPATAIAHYGSSTIHTNSLNGVAGFGATAPEIVETARALKNNPDLIFEFVHNQIQTEFAFGERKGALGALIDKSGTPFDQNVLFVSLFRVANPYAYAQYQIAPVTIAQADFTAWTGISDIQAACRLLANGGIPAAFNGATSSPADCSQTGTFTSVTILHVWSQVQIGGAWYAYDPSFKVYSGPAPVDLVTESGIAPGGAAGAAMPDPANIGVTSSGVPWIVSAKASPLNTYLTGLGTTLLAALKSNQPALDTDTVVGITKIQPLYSPTGGWRNTTPPGYTVGTAVTVADIPDQYRTKFSVSLAAEPTTMPPMTTLFSWPFFVDDIDGRRIGIDTNFDNFGSPTGGPVNPASSYNNGVLTPLNYTKATERLVVDDTVIISSTCQIDNSTCFGGGVAGQLTLTATHPYTAGTFADETVVKPLTTIAAPVAIVSGWGRISPARLTKWSDEVANDKALPHGGTIPYRCDSGTAWCRPGYGQSAGDQTRQKLAASWLAEMTRMLALQSWIGGEAAEHHHSIGVVDWRQQLSGNLFPAPPDPSAQNYLGMYDEFTDLNIDTVISLTARTSTAANLAKTPAVSRSVAVAAAALEGSVLEQMEDLPDTASTASRFAWGNQPDGEDPCFPMTTPRRFYDFTGSASATRAGLYLYEGTNYTTNPVVGEAECSKHPYMLTLSILPPIFIGNLESTVASYLGAGFHVTASAETFLGPGARFGPAHQSGATPYNDVSQQRGGAIVATQFDGSGNVLQVAHVLTQLSGLSKGGGGKQPESFSEYDPAKAADALKDRFVDRSVALGVDMKTGTVGYTTPSLISVGAGSTPYKLDYALSFKAAPTGCNAYGPCTGPIQGGWNQTWDARFSNSGSGIEAMGGTSPFAAAGSLVAYLAMQDIFGQSGLTDLNKDVFAALTADWWRQQMVANTATVNRGFSGQQYVRLVDGSWMPPIGGYGVLTQTGYRVKIRDSCQPQASQEYPWSTSRRWDHSGVTFSLRNAGGDVLAVAPWSWNYDSSNQCSIAYGYQPATWTWPQGPSLSFTYDYQQGVTGITTHFASAQSRAMTFTGLNLASVLTATTAGQTASGHAQQITVGQVLNSNGVLVGIADAAGSASGDNSEALWSFTYTPVQPRTATQRPVPYPQLSQVFEPVNANTPALQYSYDTRGVVETASDATALQWQTRGAYTWLLALSGRGERDDPTGAPYTVYYDTDGNEVLNIDELGRQVASLWDGRHRITRRTFQEGDQERFYYDSRDNVTALTKVPSSGSLANITVRASYEGTWDHLAYVIDAMGNETDFTYYAAGVAGASLMSQAQRPSVNGSRPTFTFQYDVNGLPTQSVDPDGITTGHVYDGLGNLTSTTEGAAAANGSPALNLTTTSAPDTVGNVTAVVDPLGNATTTQFDAMHRKLAEQNRNGGVAAVPLMAKTFVYDANGRSTTENRATGFNGSGVATGWQTWLSAYTPTGKTAVSTDPIGEATRTIYDALDRPLQVIDPSGRVTAKTYDAAGEELTEVRGLGAPSPITYSTFTWGLDGEKTSVKDANGNTITLGYDGFLRLASITHPDLTTEASQYDPDGDLTIWTNRGGFSIVRCYDVLNRKLSDEGRTGAANDSSACPAGGTANLTARPWDMHTRSFTYDAAGHLLTASTDQQAYGWTYDAAGRPITRNTSWSMKYSWDNAGNLTGIHYPDANNYTYGYDALNRTTSVSGLVSGVNTTLASLTYDALGRRNVLTFGDASWQSWGYDGADHVIQILQRFPTTTDNAALVYGYDAAGREILRTSSNIAYRYTVSASSTPYAAANALNQYPSVNSYPYTYWPEGPLMQDDQRKAEYDENNQLTYAYITPMAGTVDPNNREIMYLDPLGHLYYRTRQVNTTDAYPLWYHATDGLRPETIVDWQYTKAPGVSAVLQGTRDFLLGPNPDERWAFIETFTNPVTATTYSYPHTDRDGSTIALSQAGVTTLKYTYGAYGESAAPFTEAGPGMAGYAFRYTGQRLDGGTGLYDYKARFYSPQTGRFLQPDPAGVDQGPNLYLYVGDDPTDQDDPLGSDAWLVSRAIIFLGVHVADHMFVVVADKYGGTPKAQFDYGPQRESVMNPGQLVELHGTTMGTRVDDDKAWHGDPSSHAHSEVINAPDAAVIAAGNKMDTALGTPAKPGEVKYSITPNGSHEGNSNGGAYDVANGAVQSARPGAPAMKPPAGSNTPGWDHPINQGAPKITCTGSRIPQSTPC